MGPPLMPQGASAVAAPARVQAGFSKDETPSLAPVYSKTQNTMQNPQRSWHAASLGPVAVSGTCLDNLYLRGLLCILRADLVRDLKFCFVFCKKIPFCFGENCTGVQPIQCPGPPGYMPPLALRGITPNADLDPGTARPGMPRQWCQPWRSSSRHLLRHWPDGEESGPGDQSSDALGSLCISPPERATAPSVLSAASVRTPSPSRWASSGAPPPTMAWHPMHHNSTPTTNTSVNSSVLKCYSLCPCGHKSLFQVSLQSTSQ